MCRPTQLKHPQVSGQKNFTFLFSLRDRALMQRWHHRDWRCQIRWSRDEPNENKWHVKYEECEERGGEGGWGGGGQWLVSLQHRLCPLDQSAGIWNPVHEAWFAASLCWRDSVSHVPFPLSKRGSKEEREEGEDGGTKTTETAPVTEACPLLTLVPATLLRNTAEWNHSLWCRLVSDRHFQSLARGPNVALWQIGFSSWILYFIICSIFSSWDRGLTVRLQVDSVFDYL